MTPDGNAEAAAATARDIARQSVKAVKCKDCGARCAWAKSKRTGTWYLCDTIAGAPGLVIPLPHRPHFKTCGT